MLRHNLQPIMAKTLVANPRFQLFSKKSMRTKRKFLVNAGGHAFNQTSTDSFVGMDVLHVKKSGVLILWKLKLSLAWTIGHTRQNANRLNKIISFVQSTLIKISSSTIHLMLSTSQTCQEKQHFRHYFPSLCVQSYFK